MPYKVFETGGIGKRHCVYKLDGEGKRTGESLGCHSSPAKAGAQMRALYAADDQRKEHDKGKAAEIAEVYESLDLDVPVKYSAGQKRDESGKWSEDGGGGDTPKLKTHSVKLPENKKKLSIQKTVQALGEMGMKFRGKGEFDHKTKTTSYEVERPDGSTTRMGADEMRELVYKYQKGDK